MKPIKFKEMNMTYAAHQSQYVTLPAHTDQDKVVTSCWKGDWIDRIQFLLTGRVWVQQFTFGNALRPMRVTGECPLKEQA
jgi:hypothetical protein